MTDACKVHYETLHLQSADVLVSSFDGARATRMATSHAFVADLDGWLTEIGGRPESVLLEASAREYQHALLALVRGHYRAAFASLRLSLELALACVRWSANERELREWKLGMRDLVWAALIDKENGVFSKQFVRLFTNSLADEGSTYRAAAESVYRECSEFVHGNAHTHLSLPLSISFSEEAFQAWHDKASVVRLTVTYALSARYLSEMATDAHSRLESNLLAHLGHSVGVRATLGAPVETTDA